MIGYIQRHIRNRDDFSRKDFGNSLECNSRHETISFLLQLPDKSFDFAQQVNKLQVTRLQRN